MKLQSPWPVVGRSTVVAFSIRSSCVQVPAARLWKREVRTEAVKASSLSFGLSLNGFVVLDGKVVVISNHVLG